MDRTQRIADLERELAAKDAQLAAKDARIGELEGQVEQLTVKVALLQAELNKNSRNSHLPPSSDGPGGRGPGKPKGKQPGKPKRKRGGQHGHEGHRRGLLPPEKVDRIVDLFPKECENCWLPLAAAADPNAMRFQVTEIPPIQPHTTEFRQHSATCQCGHVTRAKGDGIPASPFGPRLMAIITLLTGAYHVSRRRTAALLQDVLGVTISVGAISAVEGRVSKAVKSAVEEAWEQVDAAVVKHADATSWLQSGNLRSLWTIATKAATVFKILVDGTSTSIKPLFGTCRGILISDRATVFSFWPMSRRQVCWAHLLRRFVAFSERDGPAGRLGQELLDYTCLLFRYWQDYGSGKLTRQAFLACMTPLRNQLEECLQRAVAANIKSISGSCADILGHREALWTFLKHPGVDPTNNHAEQELRAFVLWRKRCFGAQSDRGNLFAERVMTVVHTARKQNKNVLGFLTACCHAHVSGGTPPSLFQVELAAAA